MTARDCQHGKLARVCDVCELEAEVERLRAALTRCHALLQDAGHWIDMEAHAEWHEAMDKELLPCDETMACPTVARSEGEERVVVAEGTYSYAASAVMSTNRGSSVRIPGWTGDGESMGLLDGHRVRVVMEKIP